MFKATDQSAVSPFSIITTFGTFGTYFLRICSSFGIFIEKAEGKKPRGRPKRRWDDNIRMDLGEIRWEDVDDASRSG
jgi:hypothetical protein